jgi:hypothetical protein
MHGIISQTVSDTIQKKNFLDHTRILDLLTVMH